MNDVIEQARSFIEEYQRDRVGIYPHRLAGEVAMLFGLRLPVAKDLVVEHMIEAMAKNLINGVCANEPRKIQA